MNRLGKQRAAVIVRAVKVMVKIVQQGLAFQPVQIHLGHWGDNGVVVPRQIGGEPVHKRFFFLTVDVLLVI
ncbi:hypothetical protein [Photorhabdus cinerea]|nr:hypothetical protein [Photorhabdus cinerea]